MVREVDLDRAPRETGANLDKEDLLNPETIKDLFKKSTDSQTVPPWLPKFETDGTNQEDLLVADNRFGTGLLPKPKPKPPGDQQIVPPKTPPKELPPQPGYPPAAKLPVDISNLSSTDDATTKYSVHLDKGSAEIKHANGTKSQLAVDDTGNIQAMTATNEKGEVIAKIESNSNGTKEYVYSDRAGTEHREKLSKATVDDHGEIKLKLENGNTVERRVDGSYVTYDAHNHPIQVKDANNNVFTYEWKSGGNLPSEIKMQGPGTKDVSIKLVLVPPSNLQMTLTPEPASYKVYEGEQAKPSGVYFGGGISGGGIVQAGLGASVPLQDRVQAHVSKDGMLSLTYGPKVLEGIVGAENVEYKLYPDGTQTHIQTQLFGKPVTTRYARNGMRVDVQASPK